MIWRIASLVMTVLLLSSLSSRSCHQSYLPSRSLVMTLSWSSSSLLSLFSWSCHQIFWLIKADSVELAVPTLNVSFISQQILSVFCVPMTCCDRSDHVTSQPPMGRGCWAVTFSQGVIFHFKPSNTFSSFNRSALSGMSNKKYQHIMFLCS